MPERTSYRVTHRQDGREEVQWIHARSLTDAVERALHIRPHAMDAAKVAVTVQGYRSCETCDGAGHVPTGEVFAQAGEGVIRDLGVVR